MSRFVKGHIRGYKQVVLNIPEEIFRKATHALRFKGSELKEYLVDFLKKTVTIEKTDKYTRDSVWNIVGMGKSKVGDLSTKHDKYLYGTK